MWSNACTIGILLHVALNFLVISETFNCDESRDCFQRDGTTINSTRITDCSIYDANGIGVVCYTLEFRGAIVLALIGGYIKIVPPIFFKVATTIHLVLLKNINGYLKIVLYFLQLTLITGITIAFYTLTFLRKVEFLLIMKKGHSNF